MKERQGRRERKLADGYSRIALPPALADELRAEQRRGSLGIAELVIRCLEAYRRERGLPLTSLLLPPAPPTVIAPPTEPETDKEPVVGSSPTLPAAPHPTHEQHPAWQAAAQASPDPIPYTEEQRVETARRMAGEFTDVSPVDPPLQEMAYVVACRRLDRIPEPVRSLELAALLELWDFASLRDEGRQLDVFMHWIEQHLAASGGTNPRSILLELHKMNSMPASGYRWSNELIVNEWRNAR